MTQENTIGILYNYGTYPTQISKGIHVPLEK